VDEGEQAREKGGRKRDKGRGEGVRGGGGPITPINATISTL